MLMKKLYSSILMMVTVLLVVPEEVGAHHTNNVSIYVSGYTQCGCPIYTKRILRYYDCSGRPVYSYYKQPVTHRCKHHVHRSNYYVDSCGNYRRVYRRPRRGGLSISYRF